MSPTLAPDRLEELEDQLPAVQKRVQSWLLRAPLHSVAELRSSYCADHADDAAVIRLFWSDHFAELFESMIVERRISEAQKVCHSRLMMASRYFSPKTIGGYEKMFAEILQKDDRQEAASWMEENIGYLDATIEKAERARSLFERTLNEAVSKKWISDAHRQGLWRHYNDPSLMEWVRDGWIIEDLQGYIQKFAPLTEKRDEIVALAKQASISVGDVPELAILQSDASFLFLRYAERKDEVNLAHAHVLAAIRKKQVFAREAESRLKGYARGGDACITSSMAAEELLRILSSQAPEKELRAYEKNVIPERKSLIKNFDQNQKKYAQSPSSGIALVSRSTFLGWSSELCASYLSEMETRFRSHQARNEQEQSACSRSIADIRTHLDAKDWEGAEQRLTLLRHRYPDDAEAIRFAGYAALRIRESAVQQQATGSLPTADAVKQDMHQLLQFLPSSLRMLCLGALKSGSLDLERVYLLLSHRQHQHRFEEQSEQPTSMPLPETSVSIEDEDPFADTAEELANTVSELLDDAMPQDTERPVSTVLRCDGSPSSCAMLLSSLSRLDMHRRPAGLEIEGVDAASLPLAARIVQQLLSRQRALESQGATLAA